MSDTPLIIVTGPTASGKSALAIRLAERLGAEIVNADSVQVYRGFDIGASKPSQAEFECVPHHLFSCVNADEAFNTGMFARLATECAQEISVRGKYPMVVGGTGLYIRSLLYGLVKFSGVTKEAREEIASREAEFREEGLPELEVRRAMFKWLKELDPVTASRLDPNDLQRIQRALLVRLSSGCSLAELHDQQQRVQKSRFRAFVIGLFPPRETLYQRIDARVDEMLDAGLVGEVENLLKTYDLKCRPFGAIGYRHVVKYLGGAYGYPEMVTLLKRDTRRFAKRQMTWWRNQPKLLGWRILDGHVITKVEAEAFNSLYFSLSSFLSGNDEFPTEEANDQESVVYLPLSESL